MQKLFDILIGQEKIKSLLQKSEGNYLSSQLFGKSNDTNDIEQRVKLVYLLLNGLYSNKIEDATKLKLIENEIYVLLKTIDVAKQSDVNVFNELIGVNEIDPKTLYYFYLSSVALKSDRIINIRLDLKPFQTSNGSFNGNWKAKVLNKSLEAFILLVRKGNGFQDIKLALTIVDQLQKEQTDFEKNYLSTVDAANEIDEAYQLLGFYHLSKAIVETAKYLENGYNYKERLGVVIRQHVDAAKKLFASVPRLEGIATILEEDLKFLEGNSIWTKTKFNDKVQQLCRIKSENGYLELLPSQRDALNKNLLDVASNVTVVQMPTSAGKTLLAEFNILVTKALKQDAKIIYVVPSRALVNQIYFDLKSDLESLDLVIEKTSSAIEVDPNENTFLSQDIDILVSTPEKLDLLIRRNHPSVEDVSLFIIDEAHTIQNGQRGAKLELLLAILKRERPSAKFMLLSPFIGNSAEKIKEWLGGGNSIAIDWRPSEKIVFGLDAGRSKKQDVIKFDILPSAYSTNSTESKFEIFSPYELKSETKKDKLFEFSAKHFSQDNKCVLFLCEGKGSVDTRANFLHNVLDTETVSDEINLVRKFITDEIGRETTLSKVLEKRIATHHAGLSDEAKLLVEHLIRNREIKYVCSTTTVAEGVNFPVSSVFFDSFWKGNAPIDNNDFWNISGRAGRTLIDNFGKIVLPFHSDVNKVKGKQLLIDSTKEIASVLSELFVNGDIILQRLSRSNANLNNLIDNYYNSLGPLVQYFVHLLTVSENQTYITEIEDLFKDTFEYYQLDTQENKDKFIRICREVYNHLQNKYKDSKGILSFADKTGFSVPSVLAVMAQKSSNPTIADLNSWKPNEMFNPSNINNLTEKIKVVAALRETKLGTDNNQAPFEPEHIAKILVGWVAGSKIDLLSKIHPSFQLMTDANKRINEFVHKMHDIRFKASWGLSALEGIVKGNEEEIKDSFIPSLIYYGVDNEKSLILRMVGVPRILSFSLSQIIDNPINTYSFPEIRKMVKGLNNSDWDSIKPKNSSLTGNEWKRITEILVH
ncbi:MAG: DEAD/DEAH box helicase [Ignavibacteriae bacterium]|nr:DEAD/DEAH box helicase [Ignavibacteriota bacterium]